MKTPVELIATEPNQPPELRFFQKVDENMTTILSSLDVERPDYIMILPYNVPTNNMVLSVEDVTDVAGTATIKTRWAAVSGGNVLPDLPDIAGYYVNTIFSVPLDGTFAAVDDWSTSVASSYLQYSQAPPVWTATQNLKLNGSFNLGFNSTNNFGSRKVRVNKSDGTTIAFVEDQPNADTNINLHVVIPFVTSLLTNQTINVEVTVDQQLIPAQVNVFPGLQYSYMTTTLVPV